MVVSTLACPKSDWTVRMSMPGFAALRRGNHYDDGDLDRLTEWIFATSSNRTAHGTVRSSRFTVFLEEQAEA